VELPCGNHTITDNVKYAMYNASDNYSYRRYGAVRARMAT
jgi:hypothetical protein